MGRVKGCKKDRRLARQWTGWKWVKRNLHRKWRRATRIDLKQGREPAMNISQEWVT